MFTTIALIVVAVLVVAIIAVLILAATKPDEFRVHRSTDIKAPPEKIFPLVNEFDHWTNWSPYEHRDPNLKRTRSGPTSGKGAIYAWDGNNQVGSGRMEIADTSPPNKVVIKLDFFRPFKGSNMVEFTMEPKGETTRVTWAMVGASPYMAKIMSVFLNMDKMCGKDFETGLASMKAVAEK